MNLIRTFLHWRLTDRGQRVTHSCATGAVLSFFAFGVAFSLPHGWVFLVPVIFASALGVFCYPVIWKCLSLVVFCWSTLALYHMTTRLQSRAHSSEQQSKQALPTAGF